MDNHHRWMLLLAAAAYVVNIITAAAAIITAPYIDRIPYHTSVLSGHNWVRKLLDGHPDHIKNELGMRQPVFLALVAALRAAGLLDSCKVLLNEQVAIFLYMCVTGLKIQHVGKCFQHANETISKYTHYKPLCKLVLIVCATIGISILCLKPYHPSPSTTPMSAFPKGIPLLQSTSGPTPSFGHISGTSLELWMAHTSVVAHLSENSIWRAIKRVKSHRIA